MEKKYLVINGKAGNLAVIRKSNSKLADALETIFTVTLPNENFFTSLGFVNSTLSANKKITGKTEIEFRTVDIETDIVNGKEQEKVGGTESVTAYVKTNVESLQALEKITLTAWKAPRNRGPKKDKTDQPTDALSFFDGTEEDKEENKEPETQA
jgi:hypothetical protein